MRGKIKFVNHEKGFGFIIGDEDKIDYFFHKSAVINLEQAKKDDPVLFDTEQSGRGLRAINVQLLTEDQTLLKGGQ